MEESAVTMLDTIGTGVGSIITYVGDVISAITSGTWNALLPVIGLSIGVFFVIVAIRFVKSLIKGY